MREGLLLVESILPVTGADEEDQPAHAQTVVASHLSPDILGLDVPRRCGT
jgi:hypothetical protein